MRAHMARLALRSAQARRRWSHRALCVASRSVSSPRRWGRPCS
jgi:hypothetical protein